MYPWSLPPRVVFKIVNFKRQFEFLLNQLWDLWSIARNVPSLLSKFYRKRKSYHCSRNTNKLFQSAFINLRSYKHFGLGLPGWNLRTWVGLINRYNNFFFMLGFFPFLSWWGMVSLPISSSERKALTLCLAVSFLTLIQLVFDLLAFTDNN